MYFNSEIPLYALKFYVVLMSTSNKAFEFVSKNILGHCAHIVQSIVAHGSGSPLFIFYGEDIICNNIVNHFF